MSSGTVAGLFLNDLAMTTLANNASVEILISEVGLRDGLQAVKRTMATADKIKWIDALVRAGIREIEVASFVPAALLPQMADAAQITQYAASIPGLSVVALVPNLRGARDAIAAGAHKLTFPCSASAAHSLANVRKTREQAIKEVADIVKLRNDIAPNVLIEAGISTAFGCTIQGAVAADDVVWMVESLINGGADMSGLADTTGMANPIQVRHLFQRIISAVGIEKAGAAHMHNTRGLGIANCLAAFDVGIRSFDSSLAGLGGCPFAPGASGNVVTEDLVFMFEAMGQRTGVNLGKLILARDAIKNGLPDEPLYGHIAEAGLGLNFQYA